MPRYEFTQGTSNKFWEITLDGSSYTVVYGKIGTKGQTKSKSFDSEEKAQQEHDKAIASKTKKGYVQVGAGGGGGGGGAAPAKAAPSNLVGLEKETEKVQADKAKKFCFRTIVKWKEKPGLSQAAKGVAYRIGYSYEDDDDPDDMDAFLLRMEKVVGDKHAAKLQALTIGVWEEEMGAGGDSQGVIDFLVNNAEKLPELRAIYLGDMTYEDCEMSWIENGDFAPLLQAFPKLENLRVNGVRRCGQLASESLRSLQLQCGISRGVGQAVSKAQLPNLEHLELWLGTPDYSGDVQVEDLMPIFSGKLFPKLRYLGLRNAQLADQVAAAVATSPIVAQVEVLDLSLGCLGNAGVEALVASPAVKGLKRLDIHHHYASSKVAKKLKGLGIAQVDIRQGDVDGDDDGDDPTGRYVEVGE